MILFIFANKFKIQPRRDSNSRINTSSIRGLLLVHRGDRLKLIDSKAVTKMHMFLAQKSKCPHHVMEIDLDCLHTCSMFPCQAVDWCFFSLFCRNFWIFGSPTVRAIFFPKKKTKTYPAKINEFVIGWQEFVEHACQFSGFISKKRREHWILHKFGVICVMVRPWKAGNYLDNM